MKGVCSKVTVSETSVHIRYQKTCDVITLNGRIEELERLFIDLIPLENEKETTLLLSNLEKVI